MKSTAINLYKHALAIIENPTGNDSLERDMVKSNGLKIKANLEHRFKTSRKYKDDPEIKALIGGDKKDGKKSKG